MGGFCGKEKKVVQMHELHFMSTCSEGFSYNNPQLIDKVFNEAKSDG